MTGSSLGLFLLYMGVSVALALPCAWFLARLFAPASCAFCAFGRLTLRLAGAQAAQEQPWMTYAASVLIFNALGGVLLFALLVFQSYLPLNPQNFPDVPALLALNIAVSFVTNTNWQAYGGESTLSYFSQMVGLGVQNYLSAATGLAVAFAVIRGLTRKETPLLGNFYADTLRVTLYVLLPLSLLLGVFLIAQGVPQNFAPYVQATGLEGSAQTLPQGPVASQMAIMILGSNGGGFFNVNAAHPYQNPTPLSNAAQMIGILLLPIALVIGFGRMVGDRRQGWALFASMVLLFTALFFLCLAAESAPHPALAALHVDQTFSPTNPGGNMEGKEARFGIFDSVFWSMASTATSNGSVNAMLDSYMPLAGVIPLFNMLVGEVIFGGIGCGLYGILIYVLIAVFIAGLMVGRTPEYLGKKIESHEVKWAVFAMLLYPLCVLGGGVISLLSAAGAKSIAAAGAHGLTQTLYAYASAAANNGSSFAGLNANTDFQNIALAVVMLIGRYGVIIPVLAIAGSLAAKKTVPPSSGTLPTHSALFVVLLTGVILLFGGLTYFPVLALGPIAEHLSLFAG